MEEHRLVAILFILGSALFLAAAFNPSSAVFAAPDPGAKLEIIMGNRALWTLSQFLFGAGATLTALAVVVFGLRSMDTSAGVPLLIGGAAMLVGAVLWDLHVYQRALDPAAFAAGDLAAWTFSAYTLLTMFGLVILGLAFVQIGLSPWLGYGTAIATVLLLAIYLIMGDMPPFVYYIFTLIGAFFLL